MPRLSLKQIVEQKMTKAGGFGGSSSAPPSVKWGDADFLAAVDLDGLTRSKLKRHLVARGESVSGNKRQLAERLKASLEEERLTLAALDAELETRHRAVADREEAGAVYSVGSNHAGQLGMGDLNHRTEFVVVSLTRGMGVHHVCSGESVTFAVGDGGRVLTWGGTGTGPMGLRGRGETGKFESPQVVEALEGEEIILTSVGSSHACAVGSGGDLFSWGSGRCGALGHGDLENGEVPRLVTKGLREADVAVSISSGKAHSLALTDGGRVYAWGYSGCGRLGLGRRGGRHGIPEDQGGKFVPVPSTIPLFMDRPIRIVSCGSEHSVAVTTDTGAAYSWGAGDSGKLGHGDFADRWEPCEIWALRGMHVSDASCGTWHSACVVVIPPMVGAGWVYTWVRPGGSSSCCYRCMCTPHLLGVSSPT